MATIRFFGSLAACVLVLTAALGAQDAPPLMGSSGAMPDQAAIQARVDHWITKIKDSSSTDEIAEARLQLVRDCERLEDSSFRSQFASASAPGLLSILTDEPTSADPLRPLREINAAVAAAKMKQVGVHAVLQASVSHANPGVRLWGWRGYASVLDLVLTQGGGTAGGMFAALQSGCASEPSPLVRGAMYDLMTLPAIRPDLISDEAWTKTADQFLTLLLAQWPEHCSHLLAGDAVWFETTGQAVGALESLSAVKDGPSRASMPVLQALADMLWASYGAYSNATDGDTLVFLSGATLLTCEDALRRMSSLKEERLKTPLTANTINVAGSSTRIRSHAMRASFVGEPVLKWIEDLKTNHAISDPDIKPLDEPAGETEGDE